jgi:hypothetical protein
MKEVKIDMEGRRDRRMAMQAVQHGWHVPVKPLGFCGVQASQEIGLACIPYRRLSMQSIIFFAPQKLHEKANKALRLD